MNKYFIKNKKLLIAMFIVEPINIAFEVGVALGLAYILDLVQQGDIGLFVSAIPYIVSYLCLYVLSIYISWIVNERYMNSISKSIRDDLLVKILDKSVVDFNKLNTAEYISVLNNDVSMLESDYYKNIVSIIRDVVTLTMGFAVLVTISPLIAICITFVALLMIALPKLFDKKTAQLKAKYSESLAEFTKEVKDDFNGFEVIKSYNVSYETIKKFQNVNTNFYRNKFNYVSQRAKALAISSLLSYGGFFITISIGVYMAIIGSMSIGGVLGATQLMGNIVNPLVGISSKILGIKSSKPIKEKLMGILSIENKSKNISLTNIESIKIENLSFSYDDLNPTLKDISLYLEGGKRYMIVGESGSGKSTLLKLILNYYDNFNGNIKINSDDIRNISNDSINSLISVIHQNVFMFDASIRENITLFKEYSEEQIMGAIKSAGLSEYVEKNGLDSPVGENGNLLSGGERQRLAIARALLQKTPVIVLDEGTSSLDNTTAFSIENLLLSVEGLTLIVVNHRLNRGLLEKYDRIFMLSNGKLIEEGSFEELMRQEQAFKDLFIA